MKLYWNTRNFTKEGETSWKRVKLTATAKRNRWNSTGTAKRNRWNFMKEGETLLEQRSESVKLHRNSEAKSVKLHWNSKANRWNFIKEGDTSLFQTKLDKRSLKFNKREWNFSEQVKLYKRRRNFSGTTKQIGETPLQQVELHWVSEAKRTGETTLEKMKLNKNVYVLHETSLNSMKLHFKTVKVL